MSAVTKIFELVRHRKITPEQGAILFEIRQLIRWRRSWRGQLHAGIGKAADWVMLGPLWRFLFRCRVK